MRIEKDFKEFLSSLVSRKAKFLIVGGFAYSYYAEARFTKDLDVFVERSEENSRRVSSAVRDFLGDSLGLKASDLLEPRTLVQLGFPPLRIDITTHCDGILFRNAWKNRVAGKYGDLDPPDLLALRLDRKEVGILPFRNHLCPLPTRKFVKKAFMRSALSWTNR